MKKFLVAILLLMSATCAFAMNDNQKMSYNCYGDHDMNVYFINERGLMESYPMISYEEKDGDK